MRPNLLFLYTDEQRFDTLAAYGNDQIEMPHLNRLADTSCVCDKAYVTQPVCTPARSSIMTGLMPHGNGCITLNIPLDETIPCLPEHLPADTYATAHMGKWHLGDEVFAQHGFAEWVASEEYNKHYRPHRDPDAVSPYARWLIDQGMEPTDGKRFSRGAVARLPEAYSKPAFLGQQASAFIRAHQNEPFCLYVGFLEPHMPFTGPRDGQYDPASIPLPANYESPPSGSNHYKARYRHAVQATGRRHGTTTTDPDSMRQLIARYWGLCSQVDTHCGVILDALRDCGLWDNTIIVFTSDHGDMMGSHQLIEKSVMYEESVRVPLLVKLPGQDRMRRIMGPVSQVDLMPTLLDMMAVAPPAGLHGRSRAKTFQDPDGRFDQEVVIEWNASPDPADDILKRLAGFPLDPAECRAADHDPVRTIVSADGRWKLCVSPELGQHELFDRQADPGECVNIFGRADTRQVVAGLVEQLRAWQERTDDPVELPVVK